MTPPSSPDNKGQQNIDLPGICEAVGFPRERLTPELIQGYFLPCVVDAFADGEIVQVHAPLDDSGLESHFGAFTFKEGTLASKLVELAETDDPELQKHMDGLIRFSASVFAGQVALGQVAMPATRNVTVDSQRATVSFDGREADLARQPELVVDYGPGLQGRHHIDQQLVELNTHRKTYHYFALGKGPFVNEFLMGYWRTVLGGDPTLLRTVIANRFYLGREDGIAAATTELAESQTQHTGTAEIADLVIASGVHNADRRELETGMANARQLLKEDGTLLIRAPKNITDRSPTSVPAQDIIEMALGSGFDVRKARFADTLTGGHFGPPTESLSVTLRK